MTMLKNFFRRIMGKDDFSFVYSATDVGKERDNNEDYFLIAPQTGLMIVADGMGGHNAGEVASKMAAEIVHSLFPSEICQQLMKNEDLIQDTMKDSLLTAHKKIMKLAQKDEAYRGMGCTIVVALIFDGNFHLCHVGDARAYLSNLSGIELLTTDHSVIMDMVRAGHMTMEEARQSPIKNELSQAIGPPKPIDPDYCRGELKPWDRLLLCSDGLWDMLSDEEIHSVLMQGKSAESIGRELIERANMAGGLDNVTVAIWIHASDI